MPCSEITMSSRGHLISLEQVSVCTGRRWGLSPGPSDQEKDRSSPGEYKQIHPWTHDSTIGLERIILTLFHSGTKQTDHRFNGEHHSLRLCDASRCDGHHIPHRCNAAYNDYPT